jgi:DNA-binding response OmpR family regulator
MSVEHRREEQRGRDRRRVSRGGRRAGDRPGRYPSLLVADGYDAARVPCAQYLDLFGFDVQQAADIRDARQAVKARSPHVMLIELSLPQTDSETLADWLKQDERAASTPFIVMMSDFQNDGARPIPEKAAGVLVKPFPLAVMLEEVRRALRSGRTTTIQH